MYYEAFYEELIETHEDNVKETSDTLRTCTSPAACVEFRTQNHALEYIRVKNKHCKAMSKEVNVESTRKYPLYDSMDAYWKHINKITNNGSRLHKFNDHEVLATGSIFRGIFYDVDCDLPTNDPTNTELFTTLRSDLLLKIDDFNTIIIQEAFVATPDIELDYDSEPVILIQDASKPGKKLSFHVNITHPQIVFKSIYVIKAIIIQAVLSCMQEHGYDFFITTTKSWIDISVYRNNGSYRTLYSSKMAESTRPLLPIIKTIGKDVKILIDSLSSHKLNLQYLKDAIICVPSMAWLHGKNNNSKRIYVKNLKTKEDSIAEYEIDYPEDDPKKEEDEENEALCNRIYTFVTAITTANKGLTTLYSTISHDNLANSSSVLFYDIIKNQPLENQVFIEELSRFILIEDARKRIEPPNFDLLPTHQPPDHYKYINLNFKQYTLETFENLPVEEQMQEAINSVVFDHYYVVFRSKSRYCYLKGDTHEHNHVCFVVELVSRQWWQNCLSPACVDTQRANKQKQLENGINKSASSSTLLTMTEFSSKQLQKKKIHNKFKTKKSKEDLYAGGDTKEKVETAKGTRFQMQLDEPITAIIGQRLATVARIIFVSELTSAQKEKDVMDSVGKNE